MRFQLEAMQRHNSAAGSRIYMASPGRSCPPCSARATHLRIGEPFYMAVLLGQLLWGGLYLRDERLRLLIPLRLQ